jgi:2-polyprenyl-6-hydroxyphenyl methylase/3-demethylubiquinone-9 3-methyltransferase
MPTVLEVGCGDGALSGLISKRLNCKLLGIDPSLEGIEISRAMFKRHNLAGSFSISENYRLGFHDKYFDAVVLADVIEHVRDPQALLREIFSVLKPWQSCNYHLSNPCR